MDQKNDLKFNSSSEPNTALKSGMIAKAKAGASWKDHITITITIYSPKRRVVSLQIYAGRKNLLFWIMNFGSCC